MTETQKRGEILNNRLQILNEYLATEESSGKTFEQFLRDHKIDKKRFVSGLPKILQAPPAKSYDNVFAYAEKMNEMYFGLYMKHQKDMEMNASGVVDIDYLANESTQPFAGQEFTADGDESYAADGCGLPPIKPVRRRSKAPEKWAEYDRKKAAYDKCRAQKKEDRKEKKEDRKDKNGEKEEKKGLHVLNRNNPAFVIARSAFLTVCKLNVFRLAYNLDRIRNKDAKLWKRVKVKWYNIGGDIDKLESAISKGKSKKGIFGKRINASGDFSYDGSYSVAGVDDAAILGYISSATAIIAAFKPIISEFKKKQGESTETPDISMLPTDEGGPVGDVLRSQSDAEIDATETLPENWWDSNWKVVVGFSLGFAALIGIAIAIKKS